MKSPRFYVLCMVITILVIFGVFSLMTGKDTRPVLHIYTWSDYIDPELVEQFEKDNGCRVVTDTFDDNESMLAKLLAGGGGYDVIFPSSYIIPTMVQNGLISKLDMSKLPNVEANFDNRYTNMLHKYVRDYTVPYALSVTGIAYRKDVVDPEHPLTGSWRDLLNPCWSRRVSILRDMREILGISLLMQGNDINSTSLSEIDRAVSTAIEFKNGASKMDNEAYRAGLASGEVLAAMGYSTDVLQIMFETSDDNIGFYVPTEGGNCCWDEMVISSKANEVELAYKFIDYLFEAKVAAQNMAYICAPVPNSGIWSHLDDKYVNNKLINMPAEELKKLHLIEDVGTAIVFYNKAWDVVTSSMSK